MKAVEAKLLEFLKKSQQFIIPIYQRMYSWEERECQQLWDDILRAGSNDAISAHFVGSIVYIEKGLYQVSSRSPLLVIDGQQRLTTIILILEALARCLGDFEPVDGFSPEKIRNYYLLNHLEKGERMYKLLLTQTDKDSLISVLRNEPWPNQPSVRVKENFEFFTDKIASFKDDLVPLCIGLAKLIVVDISLDRDQDNPQLIFESMNSTGKELSQADLIRNFMLMGLEPEFQESLYMNHWRPMEQAFGQRDYEKHFDRFMRDYLTIKTKEIPNINRVYEAFKLYAQLPDKNLDDLENLVRDIHSFAKYYCAFALGHEKQKQLEEAFSDLREFRVDVAYPFLLELYADYEADTLSLKDFVAITRLIESYVFRRAICNIPTNSLNKTFATFAQAIDKENYLESTQAYFLSLPSYRRFPNDEEFVDALKTRDLYNLARRSYWLRRIENHGRKERVPVNEYTIEHIMPQNPVLSPQWKASLGNEWERIHQSWLHTLGNLTLTGYNTEYSDRPFPEKRDMPGGFKDSPLVLNKGLGVLDTWNEEAIKTRADRLSKLAVSIWQLPRLDEIILEKYKIKPKVAHAYSIDSHPHLASEAPMRALFDAFRKEVLALDPVVTEEFFKLYVAYKAETNFVDVVPQVARLRLSLNMAFHEIDDPKRICKDVTNVGRWGNGDVEVGLASIEELPYVMGLVRQAYEKQMDGVEA